MEPVVIRVTSRTARVTGPTASERVLIVASPGPPGAAGDGTQVIGETPAGVKNGTNTVFTLANTPEVGTVAVYRNGLRERLGVGYTATGPTLTFSTAPLSTDDITADYLIA